MQSACTSVQELCGCNLHTYQDTIQGPLAIVGHCRQHSGVGQGSQRLKHLEMVLRCIVHAREETGAVRLTMGIVPTKSALL